MKKPLVLMCFGLLLACGMFRPALAALEPLSAPVQLKLQGAHQFRVLVMVKNNGTLPDAIGKLGTLIGKGSATPFSQGHYWNIVIMRSQVGTHTLAGSRPLMEINLVTDASGKLLSQHVTYDALMRQDPNGDKHVPYLVASSRSLSGMTALLPAAPAKQGEELGSMQATVGEILNYLAPAYKLNANMQNLKVTGSGDFNGRQALHAEAKGPVSFVSPLGVVAVDSEASINFAMDSGLPLSSQFRIKGNLPGGGNMDLSISTSFQPD